MPAFPSLSTTDDCDETYYLQMGVHDMAVSDAGTVHVLSPNDVLLGGLWYASNGAGGFEAQQIQRPDPEGSVVCGEEIVVDGDPTLPAALAVDDDGRPHLLYQSTNAEGVLYLVGPGD